MTWTRDELTRLAAAEELEIAARRHDGTLPTGTLTLLDNVTREVISQQTLDQNATVSVVRSGLPAATSCRRF